MLTLLKRELDIRRATYKDKKNILIILGVLVFMLIIQKRNFVSFFVMMVVMSGLSYTVSENRNNVNRYVLSCGITRKDYVISKYVYSLFNLIVAIILGKLINYILVISMPNEVKIISVHELKMVFLFGIVCIAAYYLAYFSLGIKAATVSYYIVVFSIMLLFISINSVYNYITFKGIMRFLYSSDILSNIVILGIGLCIWMLMGVLAIIFYEKKDL